MIISLRALRTFLAATSISALAISFAAGSLRAAELKEGRVTQVIKDVKLLPGQAEPRPAVVNDPVRSGTAVRTGVDSRTELTFADLTIARLGANTIFTVDEGSRTIDLGGGAVLVRVPKNSGGAKISTAAVTAAITGTTMMAEYHKNQFKFIMLEGTARICRVPDFRRDGAPRSPDEERRLREPNDCVELHTGQMLAGRPGDPLSEPVEVDLRLLASTSQLLQDFGRLGSEDLIARAIEEQQARKGGGLLVSNRPNDLTGLDVTDQKVAASSPSPRPTIEPTPTPTPTPTASPTPSPSPSASPSPSPGKFGALQVINSANLSVIDGGTTIQTDPTITRNGETGFGRIYRSPAQDGSPADYFFGSTSAFDTSSSFNAPRDVSLLPIAVFKFQFLTILADPMVSTVGGATSLALIAVDGINTGEVDVVRGLNSPLHFGGIKGLLLATQNGSITLGSNVSFADIPVLYIYARGANSDLTIDSAITGTTNLNLVAERNLLATDSLSVSLVIDEETSGFNITLHAGHQIHIGDDLDLSTEASGLENGGNIFVRSEGDMTIGGAFRLKVVSSFGTTGTGGNITVFSGGSLTAGLLDFNLDFNASEGVEEGVNLSLNVGENLTTTSGGIDLILYTPIANTLTNGGNLTLTVGGNLTTKGDVNLTVINTESTTVPNGANLSATIGGDLNAGAVNALIDNSGDGGIEDGGVLSFGVAGALNAESVDVEINNTSGGHIDNGGNLIFHVGGGLTTAGDANFLLLNQGGSIDTGAVFDIRAGNFVIGGSLNAFIDNRDGSIGDGEEGELTLQADGSIQVDGRLNVLGEVTAGEDITAGTIASTNVTTPGNIIAGEGGIAQFEYLDGERTNLLHVLTAAHVMSQGGINFDGLAATGVSGATSGGRLLLNVDSISFGSDGEDISGISSFNGGDDAFGGLGGNGGSFTVNASGDILLNGFISATTGVIDPSGDSFYGGAGGHVTLESSNGQITINNTILVSSDDSRLDRPLGSGLRESASGGNITLQSDLLTGVGITVAQTGQLLSLLGGDAPGSAGTIKLSTMGADIVVNGTVRADFGTVIIDQNDPPGMTPLITLDGGTVQSATFDINGSGDLAIGPNNGTAINIFGGTWNVAHDITINAANTSFAFGFSLNVTAGNAINFTGGSADVLATLILPLSGNSTFTAGTGGINAHFTEINYFGAELNLMSGGDITAQSITFTDSIARGNVHAAGAISITDNLSEGNITAGTSVNVGGGIIAGTVTAGTTITAGQYISAGSLTAGGDITANNTSVQNITAPTGVLRVANGISPSIFSTDPMIPAQGARAPHIYTVDSIVSPQGIDFSGNQFNGILDYTSGGLLTINATSIRFDPEIGIGFVSFNGADVNGFSTGNTPAVAGDGGVFAVNASGTIQVFSDIEATTGFQPSNFAPGGNGGSVSLTSSDTVTVGARIEVSSSPPVPSPTPPPRQRSSAKGGNISITSSKAGVVAKRAVAVDINDSGQLLSLLAAAPSPRPGGKIVIRASGAHSDVNVAGRVQADGGLVDIRHTGASGNISLDGGTAQSMHVAGDVVKVAALGDSGVLRIGNGSISADTTLQLYATGFNGEVRFVGNVSLTGNSVKSIAGNSVRIDNGILVNVSGPAANVYTTGGLQNANYSGKSGGNDTTSGMFTGSGANRPLDLSLAPPLGPAPAPPPGGRP